MNANVQMDPAGRVVLPKKVRERFRLHGGDVLVLEVNGDTIELRPKKSTAQLRRVNGVLVVISDMVLPAGRDLVAESRNERIEDITQSTIGER